MGSGKAMTQAQLIHQMLRKIQQSNIPLAPRIARASASILPSITRALLDSAERQVRRGLWLMNREGNGPLRWTPSLGSYDEPRILNKLRDASKHGPTVTRYVNRNWKGAKPRQQPSPIPRRILAEPLANRGSPLPAISPKTQAPRR